LENSPNGILSNGRFKVDFVERCVSSVTELKTREYRFDELVLRNLKRHRLGPRSPMYYNVGLIADR
jgi:hypothetical protein